MEAGFDYLIVSDLHLRGGFSNPTERLYHFDAEFAEFLRYYRLNHPPDRRWTLIIGGDFIEFLYITDLPDPDTALLRGATFSKSEFRYGARTEAQKSRWKLDTVLRSSHPQLLLALARFVAEGHRVVVLRGNHDCEMFWPEVQEHFRRLIAEHHPADVGYMVMKQAVGERVEFPQWFYYVPGLLYVEHGCQYDPFCSFEYFLNPVVPETPTLIQMSIAELAIRYFTNRMKTINALAAENIKSVSEYIGWVVRGNLRILPRTLGLYFDMVRQILEKSGRSDAPAEAVVRAEHEQRLTAVDRRFSLTPGTAARIDALHATPVMRRAFATARFLALDLLASATILAAVTLVVLIWFPARAGLLAVIAAIAALGSIVYAGALRFRRMTEVAQLHRTADTIARLFDVPHVVFGHSHSAGIWPLADGRSYVNVGTWVPEGEEAYFVFFAIRGEGERRRAGLWRWNKARREPEPFQ
jgi:UDP-2,3-diacylglucosamine pyrophosphatase LpxH